MWQGRRRRNSPPCRSRRPIRRAQELPGIISGYFRINSGWTSYAYPRTANGCHSPSDDDLNTGGDGTPVRPDRLRDGRLDNASRALWFDPLAFQRVTCQNLNRPDLCHYGNSGRNIMDSPGQRNLDFSLFKNFSLTERVKMQVRGEAFNAFNTPFFGQPNNIGFVSPNSVTPDAPRVGEIRNLRAAMRVLQFGLKLSFNSPSLFLCAGLSDLAETGVFAGTVRLRLAGHVCGGLFFAGGGAVVRLGNGAVVPFISSGSSFVAPPYVIATLVANNDRFAQLSPIRPRKRFDRTAAG